MTTGSIPASVQGADRVHLQAAISAAFLDSFRAMMLAAAAIALFSAVFAALMIDRKAGTGATAGEARQGFGPKRRLRAGFGG